MVKALGELLGRAGEDEEAFDVGAGDADATSANAAMQVAGWVLLVSRDGERERQRDMMCAGSCAHVFNRGAYLKRVTARSIDLTFVVPYDSMFHSKLLF